MAVVSLLQRFNPYFTGSTTSTEDIPALHVIMSEFQSLFYWKYHFNLCVPVLPPMQSLVSILILLEVPLQQYYYVQADSVVQCFNPYFTGSTTSTLKLHLKILQSFGFNPYFTGSTTSTNALYRPGAMAYMFQSLFYWKYHFNS